MVPIYLLLTHLVGLLALADSTDSPSHAAKHCDIASASILDLANSSIKRAIINQDDASSEGSIIEDSVSIVFSESEYCFTLAEAAEGISIDYDIVVQQDLHDVVVNTRYNNARHAQGTSRFLVTEVLNGNGQFYGIVDCGLAAPPSDVPVTIQAGRHHYSFAWDGRNWQGPNCGSIPKGDPFPPGTYRLEVSLGGTAAAPGGRESSLIVGQVQVTLVE